MLVGMQNGTATLGNTLAVSFNNKHTGAIRSGICAPRSLPRDGENLCPQNACTWMLQQLYL